MSDLKRDASLYLEPKNEQDNFAQCGSCNMHMAKEKRCMIHPKDMEVNEGDSCGLYVPGKPMEHNTMSAEETGFVSDTQVRCENCVSFEADESECELFEAINKSVDGASLDPKVDPKGCCNFFRPQSGIARLRAKEKSMTE